MTSSRMMIPTIKQMRIFMSFHHICFRTRLAPLLKPCADTARLSVLSCSESSRSPLWDTLLMFSRMTPTVSSICYRGRMLALAHIDQFREQGLIVEIRRYQLLTSYVAGVKEYSVPCFHGLNWLPGSEGQSDNVAASQITADIFHHSAGSSLLLVEPPSSDFHHSV
jgi:hypothetical protein